MLYLALRLAFRLVLVFVRVFGGGFDFSFRDGAIFVFEADLGRTVGCGSEASDGIRDGLAFGVGDGSQAAFAYERVARGISWR